MLALYVLKIDADVQKKLFIDFDESCPKIYIKNTS